MPRATRCAMAYVQRSPSNENGTDWQAVTQTSDRRLDESRESINKISDAWSGGVSQQVEGGISSIGISRVFSTFYFSLSTSSSAVCSIAWLDLICVAPR